MLSRPLLTTVALGSIIVATACSSKSRESDFSDPNAPGSSGSGAGTFRPDGGGTSDVVNTVPCDDAIGGRTNPADYAKSLGLCSSVEKDGYGLVSAKFTRGYGRDDAPKAEQHGMLPKFGNIIKP